MKIRFAVRVLVVSWAVLAASPLLADDELPVYQVLPCAAKCVNATPPVPVDIPKAVFPDERWTGAAFVEGFAIIRYTVGIDGLVREAAVTRLIGPPEFGTAAADAVRRRIYQPATVDGKPVEVTRWVWVDFKAHFVGKGARPDIADGFRKALALIHDGKLDEALKVLTVEQSRQRLNFYERSMIAYATALIHAEHKNWLEANDDIGLATIHEGANLDRQVQASAVKLRIRIDLQLGQVADALQWLAILKKLDLADDATQKFVDAAMAKAASLENIFVTARIPQASAGDSWWHTLYRRTFSFADVEGKLDRFELACDQQSIASDANGAAEWHVPKDWSNCRIVVHGPPGTKFDLVESN